MKIIITLIIIVLILSIGISIGLTHRGLPIDFIEYEAFNTSVRCVFYGARSLSCWEVLG